MCIKVSTGRATTIWMIRKVVIWMKIVQWMEWTANMKKEIALAPSGCPGRSSWRLPWPRPACSRKTSGRWRRDIPSSRICDRIQLHNSEELMEGWKWCFPPLLAPWQPKRTPVTIGNETKYRRLTKKRSCTGKSEVSFLVSNAWTTTRFLQRIFGQRWEHENAWLPKLPYVV